MKRFTYNILNLRRHELVFSYKDLCKSHEEEQLCTSNTLSVEGRENSFLLEIAV